MGRLSRLKQILACLELLEFSIIVSVGTGPDVGYFLGHIFMVPRKSSENLDLGHGLLTDYSDIHSLSPPTPQLSRCLPL